MFYCRCRQITHTHTQNIWTIFCILKGGFVYKKRKVTETELSNSIQNKKNCKACRAILKGISSAQPKVPVASAVKNGISHMEKAVEVLEGGCQEHHSLEKAQQSVCRPAGHLVFPPLWTREKMAGERETRSGVSSVEKRQGGDRSLWSSFLFEKCSDPREAIRRVQSVYFHPGSPVETTFAFFRPLPHHVQAVEMWGPNRMRWRGRPGCLY